MMQRTECDAELKVAEKNMSNYYNTTPVKRCVKKVSLKKRKIDELRKESYYKTVQYLFENERITNNSVENRFLSNEQSIRELAYRMQKLEDWCEKLQDKILCLQPLADKEGVDINMISKFNMLDKRTNSQAGEDSILAYVVAVLGIPFEKCSYLDLGANHAKEMSNTYFFYTMGARGVLVEANPQLIPELMAYRYEDKILNRCVADKSGEHIVFKVLNIDGLSTFDDEAVKEVMKKNKNIEILQEVTIESITVNEIMEEYFAEDPVIMSVDIEGKDIDIINSIDFEKHRPLLIVIEMIEYSPYLGLGEKNKVILEEMNKRGYREYAFTGINSIFIDENKANEIINMRKAEQNVEH